MAIISYNMATMKIHLLVVVWIVFSYVVMTIGQLAVNNNNDETTTFQSTTIDDRNLTESSINKSVVTTTVESVDRDLPTNFDNSTAESIENEHLESEDNENDDDDDDEEEDYDTNEPVKSTTVENVEEDSDDYYNRGDEDDDDDDDEEYEEPGCTVKTLLENMNLTAMLPQDGDVLRQEYDQYMLSDDPLQIRTAPSANHTFQRLNRLVNWFRDVANQQQVRAGLTNFLHQNFDIFLNLELDSTCINSIISILVAIRKNEPWALKFIDSAPKIPSGIMNGVSSFLGSFDECISIENPSSLSESYTGQYCAVKPLLPLPATEVAYNYDQQQSSDQQIERLMRFYTAYNVQHYFQTNPVLKFVELMKSNKGRVTNFGICLPSTCNARQLEIALNKFLYPIIGIPLEIQDSSCWTKNKTNNYWLQLDGYAQFAILTISVLVVLVGAATLYDLHPWLVGNFLIDHDNRMPDHNRNVQQPSDNDKLVAINTIVEIFSAVGNTRRLFDVSPNRLMVLDTIRLFIVAIIGLCNAFYLTPLTSLLHNIAGSVPNELLISQKYFLIRAPILLNDGLLIIAGALFVRSIFRHLVQPHDLFTYLIFFVRRWIRLTSPLFGSILFLYLLPSAGYGPLWSRVGEILLPACKSPSSMASTLFHFSNWNFVRANYTNDDCYLVCNPDTWFVSIIFQLNLAFFLIVLLMYESPKKGLRMLIIMIIGSILLNISPRLFLANTRTYYEMMRQPSLWHARRSFYLYHQNIIQYLGSFSIGLLLGYAIIVNDNISKDPKSNNHHRQQRKIIIYNGLAIIGLFMPFIWVNQFFGQDDSPNELSVLFFFSIGRFIFGLSFGWIIYASVANKSPFIYKCLTPLSIQPIARLSFVIFLVQPLVQYQRMYSHKETYVMTFRRTIENYSCDFSISVVLGYFLYLLFEAPAHRFNIVCQRWIQQPDDIIIDGNNRVENRPKYWCEDATPSLTLNADHHSSNVKVEDGQNGEHNNGIISIRF
ncbi:hypothetical protein DERF_011370 [Dermatophagoides farinae]|uniref:Nose resistant-to-fluoxetine protein N-terminal domain-containing protein n=2 Tax=Dermatophagoides farinae TaxID=6954 RepID=A0A922L1K2_DERFA|nr:hypothetical protein DERF_011370 [Dermatophagoides farinae]